MHMHAGLVYCSFELGGTSKGFKKGVNHFSDNAITPTAALPNICTLKPSKNNKSFINIAVLHSLPVDY